MGFLRRIAFVAPEMTNPFARTIWYSLQDTAAGCGVQLTALLGGPLDLPAHPLAGRRVYDLLDERNFDGILLFSGALGNPYGVDAMKRFVGSLPRLPLVSLGVVLEGVVSVAVNQAEAVAALVQHLYVVHGYRRFGFVSGPEDQVEARIRRRAFLDSLGNLGIPAAQIEVFPGDFTRLSGMEAVRGLSARLNSPVALVCANDLAALGAMEECGILNIDVPGRLAVVGFDDLDLASYHEPSLTSVRQPFLQLAGRALSLLVRWLDGETLSAQPLEPGQVLFRRSCGCRPEPGSLAAAKPALLDQLLESQTDATEGFRDFVRSWIPDYLSAFEGFLETGNSEGLTAQWTRYYSRPSIEQERGLPFDRLFLGLEGLYSDRSGFDRASRENLRLSGVAEARKRVQNNWTTQTFLYDLHKTELSISQINDRARLAAFPLRDLSPLGISAVALVRQRTIPTVVYFRRAGIQDAAADTPVSIDYPNLLPDAPGSFDLEDHRIVVALSAENNYLGYGVFWSNNAASSVCDYLANWFAGALSRIETLETIRSQSESLQASLEETKRMQDQLIETEKVASLGRLVAGVAHEINTPLGTGITGTSFLLEKLKEVSGRFSTGTLARSGLVQFFTVGQEALEGVLRNLLKAGELIQAFKGLGLDHGPVEWGPVKINALLGDLETLYAEEFSKNQVELLFELPGQETEVYSQSSALVQIVSELLDNALEHAFFGGTIASPRVLVQMEISGFTLHLAVTDNGRGLDTQERRHLFDPLFTTGRTRGHAGLGLHLAFRLVTSTLGGQMTVASEPGAGTCFLCQIPIRPTET